VAHFISPNCFSDIFWILLILVLGRVYPNDYHRLVTVFVFNPLQIWDRVDAVNAAVGPKIQDDYLSPKVLNRKRLVYVEPDRVRRKLYCLPRQVDRSSEQYGILHADSI
jgi:hypothetical protein